MAITLYGREGAPGTKAGRVFARIIGTLRERSEPGANAPSKAEAVGVGPRGTKQ